MNLRQATHDDIPAIVNMARTMHAESSFSTMDFDPEVFGRTLKNLIDQNQFAVVAEKDGNLVGGMIGSISQTFFGKDMFASDMGIYMSREHRSGMVAPRMVKVFKEWARLAGAKQIRPGVSTGNIEAERLYLAMGFERVGACFCMNLTGE